MSSPTSPNWMYRSSSLPIPPTSIDDSPSGSKMESEAGSRRRSTSLSRVRETLDRTTSNFKKRCEKKLLKMVEHRLDIPSSSSDTPCGFIYHVPEIPGDHTRESVANILNQSVDWLRGNPERGTSPFNSPDSLRPAPFEPDLLDFGTGSVSFATIQPSSFPSSTHKKSVTTVKFIQPEIRETNQVVIETSGSSAPAPPRGFVDPYEQAYSSHGHHNLPPNDSKPRFSFHQDLEEIATEVRPTAISCSSLQGPAHSQSRSRIQKTTITIAARQGTNPHSLELASSTRHDMKANSNHYTQRSQPFQSVVIRRKPCPDVVTPAFKPTTAPRSPPQYLGVGLRPILPTSLTIKPVVPTTATTSTEVLDRINATQSLRNATRNPRTLSRKRSGRDLRALRLDQLRIQDRPHPDLIVEEPSLPLRTPPHGNVAAKISRFEEPLPSILQAGQVTFTRKTSRSDKRRGIYSPLAPTADYQAEQTKNFATKDVTKTATTSAAKPFGEFQPYRSPTQQATRSEQTSSQLPPVPQTGRGSMLREIKRELFPDTDVDFSASNTARSSLLQAQDKAAHDNKGTNKLPLPKELSPQPPHLAPATRAPRLPHTPYSRSIVRRGNLNELGGRVVEIRKQFEEKKSEAGTRMMPSISSTPPNLQERSSSLRGPTARQHPTETDLKSSTSTISHPFYNHSNEPIDNLQSAQPVTTPNPSPTPQHRPHLSQSKLRTTSHSHSPPAATAPLRQQPQYKPYRAPPPPPTNTTTQQPLYATLHPDQAPRIASNPTALRTAISHTTRDRLQAAADEANPVPKFDYVWEWKRFTDVEWDERERARGPRAKVKPKVKDQNQDRNM